MTDTLLEEPKVGIVHGQNLLIRQSWWNQLGLLAGAAILAAAAVYLALEYPGYTLLPVEIGGRTYGVGVLAVVPLILLLKVIFRVYNERFVLAPEYLIDVTGRLTWRERSVRLEYRRIQEIEIAQTILQRILGLGDVRIVPIAGTNENAFNMNGVRYPRLVKDVIRARQKADLSRA